MWYGCPIGPTIGPRTYHPRSYDVNRPTNAGHAHRTATRPDPARGGRRALACPDDGSPLTYDRLAAEVLDIASRLRSAGVGRGDRVAVVLPNGPEIIELLFALAALGATMAPLNPAYTEPEYRFYLDDLAPQLLLVGAGSAPAARAAAERAADRRAGHPAPRVRPPRLELDGRSLAPATFEDGRADDAVLLLHTSGTTSRPKQVPLLQRNLTAQARSIATHYGLAGVRRVLLRDATVPRTWPGRLHARPAGGRRHGRRASPVQPASLPGAGARTHAVDLAVRRADAAPDDPRRTAPRPSPTLRFLRSCSSALPLQLMREAEARYGVPMIEAYGMTEATHQMTSNPLPPAARVPGSVGVPAGAEVRIVDASGADVRAGASGRGCDPRPGRHPRLSEQPGGQRDGVLRRLVSDGRRGRARGRLPAAARAAEGDDHPRRREHLAVRDRGRAAGAPAGGRGGGVRRRRGEVRPDRGRRPSSCDGDATPDELRRHARESLAAFKVPDRVHVLDEIPKTRHRQGAALAAGRAALGRRPVRFAVLGAGAIGAYVGAALARGGRGRDPDRPRRAPAGHGGARRPRPQPARRLRGLPGGHLRDRGDRRRRRRRARAEGVQPARSSHRRIGELLRPGAVVIAAQNGIPWWYFQGLRGALAGRVVESVDPGGVVSRSIAGERVVGCVVYCSTEIAEPGVIRHIEGTRFSIGRPGGGPDDTCRAISEAFVAGGLKCPVDDDLRPQIWLKLVGNAAFNPITTSHPRHAGRPCGIAARRGPRPAGDAGVRSGAARAGHRAPGIARAAARGGARGRRSPDVDAAGLDGRKAARDRTA